MISIKEALQILQDNLPRTKTETIELAAADDRYLAENIMAPESSPRYTNSAMDGYAVRWDDIMSATEECPVVLNVVGESKAGLPFDNEVRANEATIISTGAMLPIGADTVVRVEDTRNGDNKTVEVFKARSQGQDIRYEGEEFAHGDELLTAGTKLAARQLALLASVGQQQVKVFLPPQVAILTTGSELAAAGDREINSYQIRDSNSIMLESVLREAGAVIHSCSHIEDELQSTIDGIGRLLVDQVDIIICSGGVSVGEHDYVKEAAERAGFEQLFWGVKQKPGKPLFAARKDSTYLFGLPGNPVSVYICYMHYLRPFINAALGREMSWPTISAKAAGEIVNNGNRAKLFRVKVQQPPGELPQVVAMSKQYSHMLSSIIDADGYIIVEAEETVRTGDTVETFLF